MSPPVFAFSLGGHSDDSRGWDDVFQRALEHYAVPGTVGRDLALVQNYEIGANVVNGVPVQVKIRATNLYRKEDGTWKMIGHHTDLLPFLGQ